MSTSSRVRRAQLVANELEELAHRVSRFPTTLGRTVDDVELWLCRSSRWEYRFEAQGLRPTLSLGRDRIGVRVRKDNRIGSSSCTRFDEATWRTCVDRALETSREAQGLGGFSAPRTRKPGPLTFDPDLCDALLTPGELHRLSDALVDNLRHEASRTPGLSTYDGQVRYVLNRYVVGTRGGVAASLHGGLWADVTLNRDHSDAFHVVHNPESLQPLALLGARTLRARPLESATPAALGLSGRVPVVLHPRAFEALLRRLALPLLTSTARRAGLLPFRDGERIAHASLTLVEDAGLDGLASSRHFDDEGTPTRRNPLVMRGRLTQTLQARGPSNQPGSGASYRTPRGSEDPQDAAPRPSAASIYVERGEVPFHEMIAGLDRSILVHSVLGLHAADPATTRFSCGVGTGLTLERNRESRLLTAGTWNISGAGLTLPGAPDGLLSDVVLSRELYDTGTAILPYCLTTLSV
ncbi:MAG: metallopeptidase TldD-related protein [Bradymonadia bacterium]